MTLVNDLVPVLEGLSDDALRGYVEAFEGGSLPHEESGTVPFYEASKLVLKGRETPDPEELRLRELATKLGAEIDRLNEELEDVEAQLQDYDES